MYYNLEHKFIWVYCNVFIAHIIVYYQKDNTKKPVRRRYLYGRKNGSWIGRILSVLWSQLFDFSNTHFAASWQREKKVLVEGNLN